MPSWARCPLAQRIVPYIRWRTYIRCGAVSVEGRAQIRYVSFTEHFYLFLEHERPPEVYQPERLESADNSIPVPFGAAKRPVQKFCRRSACASLMLKKKAEISLLKAELLFPPQIEVSLPSKAMLGSRESAL